MPVAPRVVWMPGGVRTEIHLDRHDTGGAFCLLVDHPPAGWSLPAHLHRGVAETIHVVEGEFEMEVEGQSSRLKPGHTVHVPADTLHAGGNVGAVAGRRIVIFSPAGMERFFLEAGAASDGDAVDTAALLASAQRHGWEFRSR
jgi:quercetin dioxygenase-like cupin family protein